MCVCFVCFICYWYCLCACPDIAEKAKNSSPAELNILR